MTSDVKVSITEVTVLSGKTKAFKLDVDGKAVKISVDEALFTNYQNQFYRQNPTSKQKNVYATLMNLMRAAYKQGLKDAKK